MGLLDFISNIFNKTDLQEDIPQDVSPITVIEEKPSEPSKEFLEYCTLMDKIHDDNISSFDRKNLLPTDDNPLTCIERSFLKYISGRSVQGNNCAAYWTHGYKIHYSMLMSKFFNQGLLTTGFEAKTLTVAMLKKLLRMRGLPTKGKKADLLARIEGQTALTPQEILELDVCEIYIPTEEGKKIIERTPDSITKDPDFEDEVLLLIQENQLDTAYEKVMAWRNKHSRSQDFSVDLPEHRLSNLKRQEFEKTLSEASDQVIASGNILMQMLGENRVATLLKRLGKYSPPPSKEIIFTKEEVSQHEREFFAYWENVLRKEKVTIEAKRISKGWRFFWQDRQIGQIGFSEYGHWAQWIEGAYPIDWKSAWEKPEDEQDRYFHDASGTPMDADNLDLQECIDKTLYWIQYTRVLMEKGN